MLHVRAVGDHAELVAGVQPLEVQPVLAVHLERVDRRAVEHDLVDRLGDEVEAHGGAVVAAAEHDDRLGAEDLVARREVEAARRRSRRSGDGRAREPRRASGWSSARGVSSWGTVVGADHARGSFGPTRNACGQRRLERHISRPSRAPSGGSAVGQKTNGHHGARAVRKARAVASTAPARCSTTSPASASVRSDVPPRKAAPSSRTSRPRSGASVVGAQVAPSGPPERRQRPVFQGANGS